MTADGSTIERRLGAGWRDHLEALLTRQLELYGELDALCNRQRGLIEAGETDRLMGLLSERTGVVERITEAAERFAPFAELWPEIEHVLSEGELRDTQRRLDAIASLAGSVAERDEADGATMRTRRDELADRLAGLDKSRRAANAYAGPRPGGARFQDREG